VVLVTDGQPTQCQNPISVAKIEDEAQRGLVEIRLGCEPRVFDYG